MLTWQHVFCLSLLILTVVLFALITAILDLADKLSICRCCFHCTMNVCVCSAEACCPCSSYYYGNKAGVTGGFTTNTINFLH